MIKASWRLTGRQLGVLIVFTVLAIVLGANAHLVHVAFQSQPDCALVDETSGAGGVIYRAAKPAC